MAHRPTSQPLRGCRLWSTPSADGTPRTLVCPLAHWPHQPPLPPRQVFELLYDSPSKEACIGQASEAYHEASDLAAMHLPAIHLTRLSLALNYSVFLHEVVGVYPGGWAGNLGGQATTRRMPPPHTQLYSYRYCCRCPWRGP